METVAGVSYSRRKRIQPAVGVGAGGVLPGEGLVSLRSHQPGLCGQGAAFCSGAGPEAVRAGVWKERFTRDWGRQGETGRGHGRVASRSFSFAEPGRRGRYQARARGEKPGRDGTEEALSGVMVNREAQLGLFPALKSKCQLSAASVGDQAGEAVRPGSLGSHACGRWLSPREPWVKGVGEGGSRGRTLAGGTGRRRRPGH